MTFDDLVAPLAPDRFLADHWGKRPVHLPAPHGSTRAAAIDWARLNELLAMRAHWSEEHIKLVMNSRAVSPDFYMDPVALSGGGTRMLASPAKVETFLAMGASLVADQVQDADPHVRALTDMLAERFAARVDANLYASFKGVQAFGSHYDLHEVFAVQCAGEKRWRVYAHRAENPLELWTDDGAQARIDALKGPVAMDVVLRPGDVLYIPRGYYHDAIASAAASLHLTLSVTPHSGRVLFGLLERAAMADPAFRAYLPDARDPAALAAHLADLARRLSAIVAAPAFREDVQLEQARRRDPGHRLTLPDRPALQFYARTDKAGQVARTAEGTVLKTAHGQLPIGLLGDVAAYLLARPAMSLQELAAGHPHHDRAAIAALLVGAERLGLVGRYQPQM